MSLTQCTMHRCHGHKSTRAIAARSLSWSPETARARQPGRAFSASQGLSRETVGLDFANIQAR